MDSRMDDDDISIEEEIVNLMMVEAREPVFIFNELTNQDEDLEEEEEWGGDSYYGNF